MSNIALSQAQWLAILTAFKPGGIPMPFIQEILLLEILVAGTTHVENIKDKTADLDNGAILGLVHDADNPYDKFAIAILNRNNQQIGYVPKEKNEVIANLLDAGKLIFGKVEKKETSSSDWVKITAKIYMRDL